MGELRELIEEYISEAKLMQIATSKDNKPWVATVWFVSDESLNLYFLSRESRRHSLELKQNQNVAGTIVIPHIIGSGQKVRGVQFEGIAERCNEAEIEKIHKIYMEKFPTAESVQKGTTQNLNATAKFYTVHPKLMILFDEVNFPNQPRRELVLP